MMSDPRAEYARRLAGWRQQLAGRERTEQRIGGARLAVFLGGAAFAWWVLATDALPWSVALVPALAFAALVVRHGRVQADARRARAAVAYHERNLERLAGRWRGVGPRGPEEVGDDHPFAADLDLFGDGSLFQLLCTARTPLGEDALAGLLLDSPDAETVRARQAAVAELAPDVDLREALALLGDRVLARPDGARLREWAAAPPVLTRRGERVVAAVLGAAGGTAALLWLGGFAPFFPLGVVWLVELGFAWSTRARLARFDAGLEGVGPGVELLAELLALFEARAFRAPHAARLAGALEGDGERPSAQLARLADLARRHADAKDNVFYRVIAFTLQLDLRRAARMEDWRARHGAALGGRLDAGGELEALCSLAGHAWEHPDDPFPEIADAGPRFVAEGLGHPLLPEERCVRNDVALDPERPLLLVSGSNMSGKSTLLRAVGTNAVLALAGAPVRARSLGVSPLALGASIRVIDSLQDGASRFFAEISRLRAIDALAAGGRPVLFLLDEILHGTNSKDRLVGATAVVAKLLERGAIGLVTTHDLALAEVADGLGGRARNVHFEDRLVDGAMHFDYRLRDGVVPRGNALALMRSLGLEV